MKLTASFIYSKLAEVNPESFKQEFSLEDLEGKTIKEHRRIKYRKFRDTRPNKDKRTKSYIKWDLEDPHGEYHYSPAKLNVIIFTDDTFLATETRGNGECAHLCSYYFNGKKTLYSDVLFDY